MTQDPELFTTETAPPLASTRKRISRAEILASRDIKAEIVYVPEWGGDVLVQALTGTERDLLEQSTIEQRGRTNIRNNFGNFRAKVVALSCVDEDGTRLFSDSDVAALGRKSAGALQLVYNKAAELSGMTDRDVEDLVGNSENALNGGSTSG